MINFRKFRNFLMFNTNEYLKIKKNTIVNEPIGEKNYDGCKRNDDRSN